MRERVFRKALVQTKEILEKRGKNPLMRERVGAGSGTGAGVSGSGEANRDRDEAGGAGTAGGLASHLFISGGLSKLASFLIIFFLIIFIVFPAKI